MIVLILVALLALVAHDASASGPSLTFDPGGVKCFEVLETPAPCDGDTSPGAISDLHTRFCVGWNEDCSVKDFPVNDSAVGGWIDLIPTQFALATGDQIPVGAIAGRLVQEATLGLLGNPCNTTIQLAFTLLNASIDVNVTITPKPIGQTDPLEPLAIDANGNGLPDGVDRYPAFLNNRFPGLQPLARLAGISLVQGSWSMVNILIVEPGSTIPVRDDFVTPPPEFGRPAVFVVNDPTQPAAPGPISDGCSPTLTDVNLLGSTLDNPCTPQPVPGASCPGEALPFENRGYPLLPCETGNSFDEDDDGFINDGCPQSGAVPEVGGECQNNTNDDFEDSDINDGCPQAGDLSEGQRLDGTCSGTDEGGCAFIQNPVTEGTAQSIVVSHSLPDADGDGIENRLDVCVFEPNPDWEPRNFDSNHDPDADGLPTQCDPNPAQTSPLSPASCPAGVVGPDEDQDCYSNRQDNCPFVTQLQDPGAMPGPDNPPNPQDTDGDDIGDACDPNPNDADTEGEVTFVCLGFELQIGGAGSPSIGEVVHQCGASAAIIGDTDCNGQIGPTDGLRILNTIALSAQPALGLPPPCDSPLDIDCDGDVDAVDALQILRYVAGLPTNLLAGCPPLGSPLPVE